MSRAFSSRVACLTAAAVVLTACNRSGSAVPPPTAQRIALFPIENLSENPEWSGLVKAIPLLLEYQLSGLRDMAVIAVNSDSQAASQHVTRELRGYIESIKGGIALRLHDRAPAGKTDRVIEADSSSLAKISQAIASQISSSARKLPTASDDALNAFAAGLGTPAAPDRVRAYLHATQVAPDFGPAWLELGAALWNAGQREQAVQAWQAALARGQNIDAISRARIRAQMASVTQSPDLPAALIELSRLLPADAEAQFGAAEMLSNSQKYADAIPKFETAIALDPLHGVYRSELGYAKAMARDFNGAVAAIDTYLQIEPRNADAIDSKGEILFFARRFPESARTFEAAFNANPAFQQGFDLRKAAEAHLLAGDTASAQRDMLLLASRAPDGSPVRERFKAIWEHRTGHRREAIDRLLKLGANDPTALAQVIVWLTQEGDRTQAAALASQFQGASGQLLRLIAQPSADLQVWGQRAQAAFPDPNQPAFRRLALTYALALDKRWAAVADVLKQDGASLNPLHSAQLLAIYRKALMELKRTEDLKRLPDFPTLPTVGTDGLFDCLVY